MNKIDITVNQKMTINTGNYSSISPSVSITIKDVYAEDVENVYKDVQNITNAFLIKEIAGLSLLQNSIKQVGINKLIDNVDIEQMDKDLQESIQNLSRMSKF